MKKILLAVLAVMMVLSLGLASAEEAAREPVKVPYDAKSMITYMVPEGYTDNEEHSGQMVVIDFMSETKPEMILVIGSDEEYPFLERLNDLTEEELQAYIDSLCEDWGSVSTRVMETEYGSKIIVLDENSADIDQCQIQSVYKGFTICLYIIRTDGTQITEDDYNAGMELLSEVWIKDIVEAE